MPTIHCTRSVPVQRTPRVMQLEGIFDVPPTHHSQVGWSAHVPFDEHEWNIGLIVGPSGCGKSTIAGELFGERLTRGFDWPADKSVVDAFPIQMSIREITALLSSVGFSSPPAWLRPYRVLSCGEQFRVTMARALCEAGSDPVAIDEFTSVVDRTAARIGSAAIARTVRRRKLQFVAVSCHYDIVEWLDPDWIYEPATDTFQWRCERRGRPRLELEVCRVHSAAWKLFSPHHYLSGRLHPGALCFTAFLEGRPAAFAAVLSFPHPVRPGWREHRLVCLPDLQGVGIGNALSEFVAAMFRAVGKPYRSTTSNPAMIFHRARSPLWRMIRKPSCQRSANTGLRNRWIASPGRITASFEYTGPPQTEAARALGVLGVGRSPRCRRKCEIDASPDDATAPPVSSATETCLVERRAR